MMANDPLSPQRITRLQREFARVCNLTTYQRANERAAAAKADKWLAYQPLSHAQLYDSLEDADYSTFAVRRPYVNAWGSYPENGRSSRVLHHDDIHTVEMSVHVRIVRRPTEMMALAHGLGFMNLDSDFVVIRQEPGRELRWCIYCQKEHETHEFIQSKRYLNNLSYACRGSKRERSTYVWRLAG
jgi:hypothetical protein